MKRTQQIDRAESAACHIQVIAPEPIVPVVMGGENRDRPPKLEGSPNTSP